MVVFSEGSSMEPTGEPDVIHLSEVLATARSVPRGDPDINGNGNGKDKGKVVMQTFRQE